MANVSRYDPFNELVDDLFKGFFVQPMAYEGAQNAAPHMRLEVTEREGAYVVAAELPEAERGTMAWYQRPALWWGIVCAMWVLLAASLLAVAVGTLLAYVTVRRSYHGLSPALAALALVPDTAPAEDAEHAESSMTDERRAPDAAGRGGPRSPPAVPHGLVAAQSVALKPNLITVV